MEKQKELSLVIIISDSSIKRAFLRKHMREDFHLIESLLEEEIFEYLSSSYIELIIIDDKVPQIAIPSFCQKIRQKGFLDTPILVITSQLKKSYIKTLLSAGASDFLHEPLEEEELLERLELAKQYRITHSKIKDLSGAIPNTTIPPTKKTYSLNRSALKAVIKAHEKKETISIIMLEIDHFETNVAIETPLTSEELLSMVEKDTTAQLRKQDKLICLGYGKFIVILPNTSKNAAKVIADEIKTHVSKKTYSTKQKTFDITLSIGLVTHEEPHKTPYQDLDSMLKEVTNYLNEAKKNGNQIITH